MKSGRQQSRGFTIVETLIYLAVTSLLLVSALTLVSGSQNKTQFNEAVNDLEQKLNTVINNVANGYYADVNKLSTDWVCTVNASNQPQFTSSTGLGKGTNKDCVFIGRALRFDAGQEQFYALNMVGARQITDATLGKREVKTMAEANPVAATPDGHTPPSAYPSSTETIPLKYGLKIALAKYRSGGGIQDTAGAVFYSSLSSFDDKNRLVSGGQGINYAPIPGSDISNNSATFVNKLEDFSNSTGSYSGAGYEDGAGLKNPQDGIWLCFNSGTTNQHVTITIGGLNSQDAVRMRIHNNKCPVSSDVTGIANAFGN